MEEAGGFRHWQAGTVHTHLKISATFRDEFDTLEMLDCRKWPPEVVLQCHIYHLVTQFIPHARHPSSFLGAITQFCSNEEKMEGALDNLSLVTHNCRSFNS